jgi:hypothetical protein
MIRREEPRVCTIGAKCERQKLHHPGAAHGIPDDPVPVRVNGKAWIRPPGAVRAAMILRALGMDRQDVTIARRRIEGARR